MGNLEQAAEKKPLIVLTGPTAVGKTALSIQLARRIGGEIISAEAVAQARAGFRAGFVAAMKLCEEVKNKAE